MLGFGKYLNYYLPDYCISLSSKCGQGQWGSICVDVLQTMKHSSKRRPILLYTFVPLFFPFLSLLLSLSFFPLHLLLSLFPFCHSFHLSHSFFLPLLSLSQTSSLLVALQSSLPFTLTPTLQFLNEEQLFHRIPIQRIGEEEVEKEKIQSK